MPTILVANTTRFVAFETYVGGGFQRIEFSGRYLTVDPASGLITSGSVNKITSLTHTGDIAYGMGWTMSNLNTTIASLNSLAGNSTWQHPQLDNFGFINVIDGLPETKVVTHFDEVQISLYGTANTDVLIGGNKINYISGAAGNDRLFGRELSDTLDGGSDHDRLHGEGGADVLLGGLGNDKLYGGNGINHLNGGEGNDALSTGNTGSVLYGEQGNDVLIGGAGSDFLAGGTEDDVLIAGAGADSLYGGDGADKLFGGEGTNSMYGDDGNDSLIGGVDGEYMFGGEGNDRLSGKEGDDVLAGGQGNDQLYGGGGDDSIFANTGDDLIIGGLGNDKFIFDDGASGAKIISGFDGSQDQVLFAQFEGDAPTAYSYFLDNAVDVGSGVLFTDGDLTIRFTRTEMSEFSLDVFGTISGGGDGGGVGDDIIG